MDKTVAQQLVTKYHDIIAEEVNVKSVGLLPENFAVTTSYVPLGQQLSSKFGKDTGQIIAAAKEGRVDILTNGQIKVKGANTEWILERHEYEMRFHGLNEQNQTVDEGVIVSLDLEISDELKAEGVAREISRFLNQLRKDANYNVDDRVDCNWQSDSAELIKVMITFNEFLQSEALLRHLLQSDLT